MLDLVTHSLLEALETSDECQAIRARIINDEFEENAKDYISACDSMNQMGEAYFKLGFRSALKLAMEVGQTQH